MRAKNASYKTAVTAVMAALAIAISALRLEFPFYPLVFLKFDLAEIPSVLAFALVGARWSYLCALFHFAGLLARGSDPLGASMKLAAVVSMLAGLQIARHRWKLAVISAMVTRAFAMSVANLAVLGFLFPSWLDFAWKLLTSVGVPVRSREEALLATLALTAVYNCLHVLLSVVPAAAIAEEVERRIGVARVTAKSE
jgi:riboflavin transporter FmnP